MRQRNVAIGVSLVLLSCAGARTGGKGEAANEQFEALAKQHIEQALAMRPEAATHLGDHRFDSRLSDYGSAAEQRWRALQVATLKSLEEIPLSDLSTANQIDSRILHHQLSYEIFKIDALREREWNPLDYNFGDAIYGLIARDFAPLSERIQSIKGRLEALPQAIDQAKANLKNPPKLHTETAISQNKGTIHMVRVELAALAEQVPDLKAQLDPSRLRAARALEDYGQWLEKELLPRSTGEFRLGEEKYSRKLQFALESDLSKDEILRRAKADLARTQDETYQVALPLYQRYFPGGSAGASSDRKRIVAAVLAKLAEKHPSNETIVQLAKDDLKSTTEFVRAQGLVSVPEEPVKIIVMPEFKRGVAVAYCDPAGALEKRGDTFFAISPTPSDWSAKRVESYFREYNDYMMQEMTIHEAMPGHYLQLAHSNRFKAPTMVRSVFHSGLFAEGWAVYVEGQMAKHGYGGPEVRMEQLKMRLRAIINAILDIQIQAGTMSEKQAMALMLEDGFQEEGEAAGKWRRAVLTSAQLPTYYVGSVEMEGIRQAYLKKHGQDAGERQMHDAMLSFGTPAPKYVRELLGL